MVVSVAQIIEDPGLQLVPVVAADGSLAVRWVATSELRDPTPFFQGGEILLTTGVQTLDWTHQWWDYIAELADAGVVAVGFGIGLTHARTPTECVQACRAAGMNLFEVPHSTTFVSISERVARLLTEHEESRRRNALVAQRRLIAAATRPDCQRAITTALACELDGAAAVLTGDGGLVVPPVGRLAVGLLGVEVLSELGRLTQSGARSATMVSPTSTTVLQPLGTRARSSHFLVARAESRFTDHHHSALTTAVALLSLIAAQERSALDARRRLRCCAMDLLFDTEIDMARLILSLDPGAPRLPDRVKVVRAGGDAARQDDALAVLERFGAIAGPRDQEMWGILDATAAAAAASQMAAAGLVVGVGEQVPIDDVPRGSRTAGLALGHATCSEPVVRWEDIVARGPLGLINPECATDFAGSVLAGLDHLQRVLLQCYLRHHGSHRKVAAELGVHRNTVRNRLAEIEAVLPGPLDDAGTRASAWIALQLLEMSTGPEPASR